MNNSIVIAGTEIHKIEYRGQQVVTFAMIDKVHGRAEGTAKDRFNANRSRFVKGEDFVLATASQKNEFHTFGVVIPNRGLTLITKRGYLKICKTLGDDRAWEVFDEMIERYFVVEEARAIVAQTPADRAARETRLFMRQALQIAALAGLAGNQKLIAANRSTRKATGFDFLAEMGVPHLESPQNDALITPSDIGKELGAISAMRVNHILAENGFQIGRKDHKGRNYWVPTEKGIAAGGVMTDVERSNHSGQARQLKWASSMINTLRDLIGGEVA